MFDIYSDWRLNSCLYSGSDRMLKFAMENIIGAVLEISKIRVKFRLLIIMMFKHRIFEPDIPAMKYVAHN